MENGRNLNAIGTEQPMTVKPLELNEHYMDADDIMSRRLKNRERQRRYRERKKLEADSKKDFVSNQLTRPQGDVESSGDHYNYVNRVHCKRNWKRDARKAHACKNLQEAPVIPSISGSAFKIGGQMLSQITVEAQLEWKNHQVEAASSISGNETKAIHSPRDWKAEARRKRN
ncbi:hypothetical protein M5689_002864 [Euphorbia peplus]|nr:hypothetical protein M5689_002864 [Euphorbia peplus]